MSSRLSDLVARAVEANTVGGRTDTDAATKALRASLTDEHIDRALNEMAAKLIAQHTRKALAEFAASDAAQGQLPYRLHIAYAVDLDGRRQVNTYDMTRLEANRALAIRRTQIEADTRSANDLARAIEAAAPHWDADPALCFGKALELAARTTRAA